MVRKLRRRFRAAAVALTSLLVFSWPAGAQTLSSFNGRVVAKHGAWNVLCDTPVGAPREQCGAAQEVVSEERPDLGITVVAFETADGAARVLRVLAPLGVFLPKGLGLNLDGEDLGRAVFVRCVVEGCQAEVVLDDALVERLRGGTNATFIVFQSPERGTGFPVALNGFGDALDALGTASTEGAAPASGDGPAPLATDEAPTGSTAGAAR